MLEHGFEIAELLFGFWRFLFSGNYRRRKQRQWQREWVSSMGRLTVIVEILLAIAFGLGVPIVVVLLVIFNLPT